jgi:hypothetical protein
MICIGANSKGLEHPDEIQIPLSGFGPSTTTVPGLQNVNKSAFSTMRAA